MDPLTNVTMKHHSHKIIKPIWILPTTLGGVSNGGCTNLALSHRIRHLPKCTGLCTDLPLSHRICHFHFILIHFPFLFFFFFLFYSNYPTKCTSLFVPSPNFLEKGIHLPFLYNSSRTTHFCSMPLNLPQPIPTKTTSSTNPHNFGFTSTKFPNPI